MGTTRIVYAPRPAKLKGPVRQAAAPLVIKPDIRTAPVAPPALVPSREALAAFAGPLKRWRLPAEEGWRMLTGKTAPAKALTEDQARRVQILVTIDAMMSAVLTRMDVGSWMVAPNSGPLLSGHSPVRYLVLVGTPGYVALLQQVRLWAEM